MARRKTEPPEELGAPMYMVQYTSLMALLLSFFVMLQTMGQKKTHRFNEGVGHIRNALGMKGGFGMLPYWRAVVGRMGGSYPKVEPEIEQDRDFVGFLKGTLWRSGLHDTSIVRVDVRPTGTEVVLTTPIAFAPGEAHVPLDARRFLDRVGAVFYDLEDCGLIVSCVVRTGSDEAQRHFLAVERAAAVARYLEDRFGEGLGGVRCMGFAYGRYTGYVDNDEAVMFVLQKEDASAGRTTIFR